MKYSNLKAIEKFLEGTSFKNEARLYLVLAKDSFARKSVVDSLVANLNRDPTDMSLSIFHGEGLDIKAFLQELHSLTMFSSQRVIVLNDLDKLSKGNLEKLEEYFARPNPSLFLVLSATAVNHSTNFYKNVEKTGAVIDLIEEKSWEKEKSMKEWVLSRMSAKGKRMDPQAAHFLLKQIGTDQATLHQEIEKLICYVGERHEVVVQDIAAICCNVNIENIWQLGEAIFRQETSNAIRITKAMLSDGVPFFSLLRQIRTQFQTEFQVCSILSNGGTAADVSLQFPYMKGQILERHLQQAHHYGMARFKKGLMNIDETEVMAKNSQVDHDLLAEMLIIKLITP